MEKKYQQQGCNQSVAALIKNDHSLYCIRVYILSLHNSLMQRWKLLEEKSGRSLTCAQRMGEYTGEKVVKCGIRYLQIFKVARKFRHGANQPPLLYIVSVLRMPIPIDSSYWNSILVILLSQILLFIANVNSQTAKSCESWDREVYLNLFLYCTLMRDVWSRILRNRFTRTHSWFIIHCTLPNVGTNKVGLSFKYILLFL